ncbi:hypothetical protein NZD89_25310 [Alicyclobacillus fastidiosus]|uniref:GP-PDE domain-containing protein n=1 Tax=Alicyclobacillus fastidiosus TaxID=392011 RepID=A0ABY6ZHC7_9BACL|nr:glycerophosphodiester phosphodiesterase family protein [Alicyclobacillus fastidiosus]WAH41519.1 hypothetical protein NZD89_25310 [Alicyclobacillus fastidiosus]GMA63169.1 glycerophosphoryl diester phosphodiesterase [Alicyclobacillus fastidiosus]
MVNKCMILGHRGFSAVYPENTRLAFRKALNLGIDGLEFDVQLTVDEVPVIIHDPMVNRTTDGHGLISSMNYLQTQQLNAALDKPEHGFQTVPALHDVLNDAYEVCPEGIYNIEIKVYNDDWKTLIDRVVTVTGQHPLRKRILFSSFHHKCLEYLKASYPSFEIGLLFDREIVEPWYIAKQLKAYSVHLDYQFTSEDIISDCHAKQVPVAVWTVDRPEQIERFIHLNTDFLISNVPDVAKRIRENFANA